MLSLLSLLRLNSLFRLAAASLPGLLLALGLLVSPLTACGGRTTDLLSTDTGNPPVIDSSKVHAQLEGGEILVSGQPGAITPGGSEVAITNTTTGASVSTTSGADGSFEATVRGTSGDTVEVRAIDGDELSTSTQLGAEPESVPPPPVDTHRPVAETCDDMRPEVNGGDPSLEAGSQGECILDTDCTAGARGRCENNRGLTFCTYDECTSDSECSAGPCQCGQYSGANTCMAGNCQVDADCGSEGSCSPTLGSCGNYSGVVGYWCHTAEDECVNDADCTPPPDGAGGPGYCMYSSEVSHWLCGYAQCVG